MTTLSQQIDRYMIIGNAPTRADSRDLGITVFTVQTCLELVMLLFLRLFFPILIELKH